MKSNEITNKPQHTYRLSRVKDGLWTVEGAYSASSDPAEYFKPSPIYTKVASVEKPHARSAAQIIIRKAGRSPYLLRAKSRLAKSKLLRLGWKKSLER